MSFTDRTLVCKECGQEFTFTAGEQEFFQQKGFTQDPKRCAQCRARRRRLREQERAYRPARSPRERRYSHPQEQEVRKYKISCARCRGMGEVNFEPDPSRPIYCKSCYRELKRTRREYVS
jgi:CxxC-x17-CxxC domain-containing protein